jgi:hypothetical protein
MKNAVDGMVWLRDVFMMREPFGAETHVLQPWEERHGLLLVAAEAKNALASSHRPVLS